MPAYDFRCACGGSHEITLSIHDDCPTSRECQRCGGQASKPRMIEEIREGLRTGSLLCRDPMLCGEMRTYCYLKDTNAMGGTPYDDRVMALGLALAVRRFCGDPEAVHDASGSPLDAMIDKWLSGGERKASALTGLQLKV